MAANFNWAVPTVLGNNDVPLLGTDAATKEYVDQQIANVGSGTAITNGTTSVNIPVADGNVEISVGGVANALVVSSTDTLVTGNVSAGNLVSVGQVSAIGDISGGNITTAGIVTATGNITGGNIATAGVLSVTGNATAGNLVTGGVVAATGNVSGANFAATGNVSGVNFAATGNIAVAGPGNMDIPGGTSGDVLSTDGAGNLSWLNIGAITRLEGGAQTIGANSSALISWTVQQNDIGLSFSTIAGSPNASISYTGTGNLVLAFTWRIVWSSPTTQTGGRRAYIRENSNNMDVLVAGPVTGIPAIIQSTTTILTLSNNSGGVDIGAENYGSDTCVVGGATTPTGDFFLAPSNECVIVLLGKY